jgi:predicted outer membrane repeat protein
MATRGIYRNFRVLKVCRVLAAVMAIAPVCALRATAYGATITVNSLSDTAAPHICTLRDAINAADTKTRTNECIAGTGSDTINFSVAGTIFLASTLPQVTDSLLTINGPVAPGIKISGRGAVQVMTVASGATLNLSGLTIANGTAERGGAIYNHGTLTVTNSTFSGNSAANGGGIYSYEANLTVTNSTFSGNSANEGGGGIFSYDANSTVTNSTFSGNSALGGGGGFFAGNNGGGRPSPTAPSLATAPTKGASSLFLKPAAST